MQIKGLHLKEIGKFSAPHSIAGLAPGLNVLIGSNEHGKSTILRALRVLFEFPHTSNHAVVRGLRPYSGGAPQIACEFSLAGEDWYLSKQYLSSRSAELRTLDGRRLYRGGDVDAALSELVAQAAGSLATLKSQWVAQGDGFQPPRAAAETVSTIQNAIAEEVSSATGGDQLDAIVQSVSSQLSTLVTPKGRKPKAGGPLHEAQRELAEISATLDDLRGKEQASAERLARFNEISLLIADDTGDEELQHLREQILTRREAIEVAQKRLAQCELATERRRRQGAELTSVEAAQTAFMERIKAFDDRRLRLGELSKLLSDLQSTKSTQQEQVDALAGQLNDLQEKQEHYKRLELLREQKQRLSELVERSNETADRLKSAQEMQGKITNIDQRLQARALDQATYERAVHLKQETEKLEIELKAQSASLEVAYLPERHAVFALDDEDLPDGAAVSIDHPVTINAPGIGQLRIVPGRTEEITALRQRHVDGCEAMTKLLRDNGFESVLELEEAWRENGLLQAERVHLASGLKQIASEGIDRLVALNSQLQQQCQDIRSGLADSDACQGELPEDVSAQVGEGSQKLKTVQYEIARLDERERQLKGEQQLLVQQLDEVTDPELVSADAREAKVTKLTATVRESTERLNLAVRQEHALLEGAPSRQQINDDTEELAQLEKMLQSREANMANLREEAQMLNGALRRDAEDGLGVQVQQATEQHAAAQSRVDELLLELSALELLEKELQVITRERAHSITQPVARRVARIADPLFADAKFGLSADLELNSVGRNGVDEAVSSISDGTREQLSVLARLAFSELLADGGFPLPLVLDDPFVFSDDQRLSGLFEILQKMASAHQIIVLTCHESAFSPLTERFGANQVCVQQTTE